MRPEDTQRSASPPPSSAPRAVAVPSRDAAVNIARGQLNDIYNSGGSNPTPVQTAPAAQQAPNPQAEQWKQYHSAWQDYYQKYYHSYYSAQAHKMLQQQAQKAAAQSTTAPTRAAAATQPNNPPLSGKDAAMFELRQKLRTNVEQTATKARKSRHFIPAVAAICVVMIFTILQYNRVFIANVQAYVSPGAVDPQNIIVNPTTDVAVGPEPKLIIPKINVNVPVVYGSANDQNSLLKAMENGVVHFAVPGASSVPGQVGNTVISGHSSNDMFDNGNYKFVFAQLSNLTTGDTIYVNHDGKRYTYSVTKKEEVLPDNVAALVYPTDKPVLTLITCTPLGTALRRLLVTAEQISPDPTAAATAPEASTTGDGAMPGNSPTLLQRIFGG